MQLELVGMHRPAFVSHIVVGQVARVLHQPALATLPSSKEEVVEEEEDEEDVRLKFWLLGLSLPRGRQG